MLHDATECTKNKGQLRVVTLKKVLEFKLGQLMTTLREHYSQNQNCIT